MHPPAMNKKGRGCLVIERPLFWGLISARKNILQQSGMGSFATKLYTLMPVFFETQKKRKKRRDGGREGKGRERIVAKSINRGDDRDDDRSITDFCERDEEKQKPSITKVSFFLSFCFAFRQLSADMVSKKRKKKKTLSFSFFLQDPRPFCVVAQNQSQVIRSAVIHLGIRGKKKARPSNFISKSSCC